MFTLPQELFVVDPKALKSGMLITRWSEIVDASGSATSVAATSSRTPGDRIRVLLEINQLATSGATQTNNAALFEVIGPSPNSQTLYARNNFYTAAATQSQAFTLQALIILPGEAVRMTTTFSAGANANTVQLRLIGYEIPRGNVM